jgi:AcrR family transcriptional regulator
MVGSRKRAASVASASDQCTPGYREHPRARGAKVAAEAKVTSTEPVRRGRGRPPGPEARVRRAVLRATRDELVEYGYAEFRIERVAERAKVHKTTLYRQWGTPTALVKEAIGDWERAQYASIDTGSWATDLEALCHALAAMQSSPITWALLRTIVVANVIDPELTETLHEVWERDAATLREPIVRAQRNGEVARHIDPSTVIEMITGPMVQRAIVMARPIDDAFVDALVATILAGTAPRPRRRRAKP